MAQRVFYYTHQLQSFIELARQQALAQAEPVELCSSSDQRQCESLAVGRSWNDALIMQCSGRVLKSLAAIPQVLRLYWVANSEHRERLSFLPNGFSQAEQGAFYVCPPAAYASLARALIVLRSGRLRVSGDYSKLPSICAVGK